MEAKHAQINNWITKWECHEVLDNMDQIEEIIIKAEEEACLCLSLFHKIGLNQDLTITMISIMGLLYKCIRITK